MVIMEKEINKYESDEAKFERIRLDAVHHLSAQQRTRLGAEMIINGFVWADTNEGKEYWRKIYLKLLAMSEEQEVTEKNGKRRI